ncbi:hypothetical protein BFW01_g12613 [Lasiodiplodia theobromae]|nr:hypothetical protein BFW01_g12613 [Lasiodiplodia theobromae]
MYQESDGPQKSHAVTWETQKDVKPEFDDKDFVLMGTGPKKKPTKFKVQGRRWNKDKKGYEYQLVKEKETTVYSELQGKDEVDWFPERKLDAA